ncbi:MAG: PKD domain-containing protein, partial [Caldisericales bacterium]|nr:PKD domain-containing protein [Caldisericales bacterium]
MNKKKLWFFVLTTVILTSFISGCIGGGQFGAPSSDTSVTIKGMVVAPDNDCFTDVCANPSITEGEPLPNADIILKGNNGHTLTGKTDCAGNYQISGLTDEGYLLYANRGEVWIKKAISPVTGDGGEANFKTTAQVILWEVVENSFPGSIPIKDIPFAIPFENIPEEFYAAVKAALADCRDAQQDATVIGLAKNYALANFGAPCAPCVEPTSTPQPAPNCPIPTAAIATPKDLGDGNFLFDASGSKAGRKNLTISKYKWDFGDGETLETTEPIVQHQYSETGTYQVTLIVVNSCGSSSAPVGVSVSYQEVKNYTLTINYVYQGGGEAAPSHTETLAEGASYNVTSPTIPGFTPDQAVVSGTMPASDVTVTVTYTQNPP